MNISHKNLDSTSSGVILPIKQPPFPVNERQFPEKPVDQGSEQVPGHLGDGSQCLFQKDQNKGQCFSKGRLLEFFAAGVKKASKGSGILVRPLGQSQHDVPAAHQGCMSDKRIIGSSLAFSGKIEKRLGHLEEHLDVPSAFIGHDDLLFSQGDVRG